MKDTVSQTIGQMSSYRLTANHQGLGRVEFVLEAASPKDAFNKFKQVVFSAKQWIVESNEPIEDPLADAFS